MWLPTTALALVCGFTGLSGSSTAWAFAAAHRARNFVVTLAPQPTPVTTTAPVVTTAPVQAAAVSMVRYAPRPGFEYRMVGGQFQGSTDGLTYTTLYTIPKAPLAGQWTTAGLPQDLSSYRFLRYMSPRGGYGSIAELEFDSHGAKLTGTIFGTAGSWQNRGNTIAKAFDGQLGSYFDAPDPGNGDFVGLDRGAPVATAPTTPVVFAPAPPVAPPAPVPAAPAPVQLPIEVMGADGTTVSVQVSVPVSAGVTGLWMQAHNLSYADKASVQVNGGAWTPLDNNTVQVSDPGKSYGGIGGAFSTIKLLLPLPSNAVQTGTNTISFRFNQTDGVSSGFRILALNLMNAAGQPVLPASAFVQDNPDTWQPPMTDAANIAAGQGLWMQGQLLASSVVRTPIQATCADCHTDDGRDLKYFNYSNYSIIERAKFHGMTATQGAQIASYIRTLNVPNPGRPWNPPYQPGPGLDEQPVQNWAAGAGVDAVLDKDSQMQPYLFPNGVTKDAISTEGDLNIRELPVPLQLLDWNHWLPRIHPKDAYGAAFLQNRAFTDYAALRANLAGPNGEAYRTEHIGNDQPSAYMTPARLDLNHWFTNYTNFTNPLVNTNTPGFVPLTPLTSQQVYSSALWQRVKVWGLMQEFSMEDLGKVAFGPRAETRTWLDAGSFMISPGKSHLADTLPNAGFLSTPLQFETLNNEWYYLGLIQNAGNGYRAGTGPIDYGYAQSRVLNLTQAGGPALPLMELVWTTKGSQQGAGLGLDDNFGWSPTSTGDLTNLFQEDAIFTGTASGWATGVEKPVVQAAMETWFDKVQSYTPQQFYAASMAVPTYVPTVRDNGYLGDKVMAYLYHAAKIGVDQNLINQIAEWGKTIWPLGNWNSVELTTGTTLASAPVLGPTGTGTTRNLFTVPNAPYSIEFDVTEKSYIDKDYALVNISDPSGSGRGYQFGMGTLYGANDLHVILGKVNDVGQMSGLQNATQFNAQAAVGKTVHVRVDVIGQDFLIRASDPMAAPQTPFTGIYPYQAELKDSTYNVTGAKIGVTYIAPPSVNANTGLHISNWKVVQSQP